MSPAWALVPLVTLAEVGLVGDSARADRRLSRGGDSCKLLDEARGDGCGRPSLLDKFRPKPPNALEGEDTCAKPP
jgi:hypothetical protein